jgi:hypothetical protein
MRSASRIGRSLLTGSRMTTREAAVEAFQEHAGLEVDSDPGPLIRAALAKAQAAIASTAAEGRAGGRRP